MSDRLLNLLNLECDAVGTFIELLDREAEALIRGHFTELPELAERKTLQAEQISKLRNQREAEQLSLGYTAGRSGLQAAAAAGGHTVQTAWRELQEQATRARDCNHRNGVMIHANLDFTRQSIGFLQASGQPLYGPSGIHRAGTGLGNTLGVG